jgi:hypothetical protein
VPGCTAATNAVILVNPLPTVTAVPNKTLVCMGGTSTIIATNLVGGPATYSWNTGATTPSIVVTLSTSAVFTVTVTNTMTGCSNTHTAGVSVFVPQVTVTGVPSNNACFGQSPTLSVTTGNGSFTITPSPTIAIFAPTVYSTSVMSVSNAIVCPASNTILIGVVPNPTVTIAASQSIMCQLETTTLVASGANTYSWSNQQTGSPISVSPTLSTTYLVVGKDVNGCTDTASIYIKVVICHEGIAENGYSQVNVSIFPNPSQDHFVIKSDTDVRLKLINELGQEILTIELSEKNSNETQVKDLPPGVYFVTDESGKAIRQKIVVTD